MLKRTTNITLILIVFIILVLLIIPQFYNIRDTYNDDINLTIEIMGENISKFYSIVGRYPTSIEGLNALTNNTNIAKKRFIFRVPKDPWGRKYNYISPGINNTHSYDLWTYGEDGKVGGIGNNADIGNW